MCQKFFLFEPICTAFLLAACSSAWLSLVRHRAPVSHLHSWSSCPCHSGACYPRQEPFSLGSHGRTSRCPNCRNRHFLRFLPLYVLLFCSQYITFMGSISCSLGGWSGLHRRTQTQLGRYLLGLRHTFVYRVGMCFTCVMMNDSG